MPKSFEKLLKQGRKGMPKEEESSKPEETNEDKKKEKAQKDGRES